MPHFDLVVEERYLLKRSFRTGDLLKAPVLGEGLAGLELDSEFRLF
jgi:hypothetical protein